MSAIRDYAEQHGVGLLEAKRVTEQLCKIAKLSELQHRAGQRGDSILVGLIALLLAEEMKD